MLAAAFVSQGIDALRSPKRAADVVRPALEGLQKLPGPVGSRVPRDPETFVKMAAAVQIGSGMLLAMGKTPRLASAALAATVLPANLGANMFWTEVDPERKAARRRDFLTDISLLGGLVISSADTVGKPSLGWRSRHVAQNLTEAVSSALPAGDADTGSPVRAAAERSQELVIAAAGKALPLLEAARRRGARLAHAAVSR
jgi:uncharacterized membrane protein YphA (DoxX/SURF4 family)